MKKASIFLLAAVLVIVACEKNDSYANARLIFYRQGWFTGEVYNYWQLPICCKQSLSLYG